MDAIAAAAGVGKGTLFRAFGTRDGLLNALWTAKIAALREGLESGAPPFQAEAAPHERLVAFLDGILMLKLENRHLFRARELGTGLSLSPDYLWLHKIAQTIIDDASDHSMADEALYTAHTLLAALHIDLTKAIFASGLSIHAIQHMQAAHARTVPTTPNCGLRQTSGATRSQRRRPASRSRSAPAE